MSSANLETPVRTSTPSTLDSSRTDSTKDVFQEVLDIPSHTSNIAFDPYGDVILVLGGGYRFQVNSGVLCLVSPVFRAMFGVNSPFKERVDLAANGRNPHTPPAPLEVPLSDDDPGALAIILRILHFHCEWIPTSENMDENKLYMMAVVCDKYDLKRPMLNWFKKCVAPLLMDTSRCITTTTSAKGRWLFIAYAFGDDALFTKVSRELTLQCGIDTSGNLTVPNNVNSDWEFIPQAVIDEIQALRQQTMNLIVASIETIIQDYSNPEKTFCKLNNTSGESCEPTILGHVIRKLGVYTGKSAVVKFGSIIDLKRRLEEIEFPGFGPTKTEGCCTSPIWRNCHEGPTSYTCCILCGNCKGVYKPLEYGGRRHGIDCSPLPNFKKELEEIVQNIRGVDYYRFCGDKNYPKLDRPPEGQNLWDPI